MIEQLRQVLVEFHETYKNSWLIERHGYFTPTEFRQRQMKLAAEAP